MASQAVAELWKARILAGKQGPKKCLTNLMLYMRNLPKLGPELRYNELSSAIEWSGRILQDHDYIDIRLIIEAEGYEPDRADIAAAVARVARERAYHPIRDYLDSLKWDNKPRVASWLHALMGCPKGDYERIVGTKFLIAAVARIYDPGCKVDNMLVLEGPQDIGKSTGLAALFGAQFFTELTSDLRDHPRFVAQTRGKWVIELAELAAMRRSDMEMVKAMVTIQTDKVRLPYERNATDHPRQFVLAATVNPQDDAGYLSDPTGNRRFWPVRATKINIAGLKKHRDQLWAEAVHMYQDGNQHWLTLDENDLAKAEQKERLSIDPWQDVLAEKLIETFRYTTADILKEQLGVDVSRQTAVDKLRVAKAMRGLGWEQVRGAKREWKKSDATL